MYADGYVGTSQDTQRIRRQQKQREQQRQDYEAQQAKIREQAAGIRQFGASTAEALENAFKNETVGLVTLEEFLQKRTTLQARLEQEELNKQLQAKAAAAEEKERRRKEKAKRKPKLSFALDEDEEEGAEEDAPAAPASAGPGPSSTAAAAGPSTNTAAADPTAAAADGKPTHSGEGEAGGAAQQQQQAGPSPKRPRLGKMGKDPTVATNFLPDREREMEEEELRQQLKKEWLAQQERIKNEPLDITYSYWDGSGHRRKIAVRQGDTIGAFLKAAREQLAPQFRELRATSVDSLMYIKEDLILPHHYTFYELILNKARGKSGPLFDFGVFEDIRIVNDATIEKQDAHAGKVVERHWYERNKHIFPASRWEIYDPEKTYDKYTIHG